MRVLVQRVSRASVRVNETVVGSIGIGMVALVGIGMHDGDAEVAWMASKVAGLRIFADDEGRMNRSLSDVGGGILAVSQFTLYGDCSKGRRPSFVAAASGGVAESWVERFAELLRAEGIREVEMGRFGAMMTVELLNEGPVTLWLEREATRGIPHTPGATGGADS